MKAVVLLDGNNAFWRSNSVTELYDAAGNRVSGIYGLLRIIRSMLDRFKPVEFIVVWDSGRSAKRKALYPTYKKKPVVVEEDKELSELRKQEFYAQMTDLRDNLSLFGIKQLQLPGTEADDIIAVLSIELLNLGFQPIIISTDNDYLQLLQIDPAVLVYSPVKNILYDHKVFVKEYGFTSDRMLEYKALIGDGADNITGLLGIGDKTAKQLIAKCQSIHDLVRDNAAELMKSKKLSKVVTEFATVEKNMQIMNLLDPCVESVESLTADALSALLATTTVSRVDHSKTQSYLMFHSFASMMTDYRNWISVFEQQIIRSKMGGLQ